MSKYERAVTAKKSNSNGANRGIKVSIVVPCCNVEKYLEECLDSIVNQTLKEIEIICVNDGSTDSTLSIIRKYEGKDYRIKVLDKPNSGYGDSMNKGFAMAVGKYIGIVESDDFVEPEMFERLYTAAEEFDVDVVKSNFWFYWGDTHVDELHEYFRSEECGYVIQPREFDNGSLYGRKPSIWSAIYKREFLQKSKIEFLPTPGASFQDTSFAFKVYSSAERMVCLYDAFLHYRQDNENSSVNNADKKAYCICDEYNEIKAFIEALPERKEELVPIYGVGFYDACIWMYERLSTKMRYSYLIDMSKWFKEIIDTIGIESLNFGEAWWKRRDIERIANNPYEYHMWRNVERYEQRGDSFIYATPITMKDNFKEVLKKQQMKSQEPYFSIIIPVYNNEKYLNSCLDSVTLQTFNNIEIICINDGSTDHSLSILEEYAKDDERIVIINQSNRGPADTRNAGLTVAIGKYVLFLDSDDYYAINACERIYKEIQSKKKPDAVIFGTELFPEVPKASDWHYWVLTTPDTYFDSVDDEMLLTKPYLKIYSWRCCFKREFIEQKKLRFNSNFKYGEDALFMFEAVVKFKGVAVISDKLYYYRHFNADSLMNQISKDYTLFTKEQLRILKQLLVVASSNSIKPSASLMQYCCNFIEGCISNCPAPQKDEYIAEFVRIIKDYSLDGQVSGTSANCQGFWTYCVDVERVYQREKRLWTKIKHFIARIVPPSRAIFYQHSARLMDTIHMQQRSIEALQQQINELQSMLRKQEQSSEKTKWYAKELIKKYNDDCLWKMPLLIEIIQKYDAQLENEVENKKANVTKVDGEKRVQNK